MVLKQMDNEVHVKGRLKTKNLEIKESKKRPGVNVISGRLTVEYVDETGNINTAEVNIMVSETTNAGKHNNVYDGYLTVMNEYKDMDTLIKNNQDPNLADIVDVSGEINSNDYISTRSGALISTNNIRANFVNRVSPGTDGFVEGAGGNIEVVVDKFIDEIKDDEPTGRKKVIAYSVGYGERVSELQNLYVGEKLADAFEEMYYQGSNGILTVKIRHYAETKEIQSDFAEQQTGFGQTEDLVREVTHWVNELEVIGGFLPFEDEKATTEEDLVTIREKREKFLEEKRATASQTQTATNPAQAVGGFGSAVVTQTTNPFAVSGKEKLDISSEDLPF